LANGILDLFFISKALGLRCKILFFVEINEMKIPLKKIGVDLKRFQDIHISQKYNFE
jgi:hypothetical protein